MKKIHSLTIIGLLTLAPMARSAVQLVTTDSPTGAGSLTAAINALSDNDSIEFAIPPNAGEVHYILTPPDGYPIITKNNITVNGYTQSGASANTAALRAANNAEL